MPLNLSPDLSHPTKEQTVNLGYIEEPPAPLSHTLAFKLPRAKRGGSGGRVDSCCPHLLRPIQIQPSSPRPPSSRALTEGCSDTAHPVSFSSALASSDATSSALERCCHLPLEPCVEICHAALSFLELHLGHWAQVSETLGLCKLT